MRRKTFAFGLGVLLLLTTFHVAQAQQPTKMLG